MLIRFDMIQERDGQTDRQTDGRTDTACRHILRLCIVSRGKNRHFYVPRPSFFVCPGDAPVVITQNVAWMKRQFSACQTPRTMYPSIFNSFPVIQTASAKNHRFHVRQPTFLFPLETPLRLSRNLLQGWKENSMLENAAFRKWRHFLSSRVLVSDNCKQLITVLFLLVLTFYWHCFKAW